jgi:tRNA A37 threonylcarbamoyladenosine dehydratase
VSNINRQIHALTSTVGKAKADILEERCREINPEIKIIKRIQFFTPKTSDEIFELKPDVVVDAIDDRHNKVHLIAECRKRWIKLVTCGGAGGRLDPSLIQVADIARTIDDPLLTVVRKELRTHHNFPRERRRKWNIPCVFSTEPHTYPQSDGSVCKERDDGSDLTLNCESGFGTSTHVTGIFGFMMAAEALKLCPDRVAKKEALEVVEDLG